MIQIRVVLLIVASVVAVALLEFAGVALASRLPRRQSWILGSSILVIYAGLLCWRPPELLVSNSIVMVVAVVAGCLLGGSLTSVPAIRYFSVAASIGDMVSFTLGPTRVLLDRFGGQSGSVVQYLTVGLFFRHRLIPMIGIGDLIFLGAYMVALRTLGHAGLVQVLVPLAGLLGALFVGLLVGGVFGIPFMAVAVVGYLTLDRRYRTTRTTGRAR